MPEELYADLYDQMAAAADPRLGLQPLRQPAASSCDSCAATS